MFRHYNGPLAQLAWGLRIIILLLLCLTVGLFIAFPYYVNDDSAMYLEIGKRLLDGQIPYVDYVEINFPLIHYLSVPPVLLARLLGANAYAGFLIFMLTLAAVSAVGVYYFTKTVEEKWPLLPEGLAACIVLFSLYAYFAGDYGQREHIFLLAYLPFFILRWNRWHDHRVDARLAVAVGILAALGVNLKPHYYLIFAAPELFWFFTNHRFNKFLQPEIYAFAAATMIYALHFFVVPGMYHAFFLELVPSITGGYSAYGSLTTVQLFTFWKYNITETIAALLFLVFPYRRVFRIDEDGAIFSLIRALALWALAAMVIYVVQAKGFFYHRLPIRISLLLLGVIIAFFLARYLAVPRKRLQQIRLMQAMQAGVLIVLLTVIGREVLVFRSVVPVFNTTTLNTMLDENSNPGDTILPVSTSLSYYRAIVWTERRSTGTYIVATPIPFAFYDELDGQQIIVAADVPLAAQAFLDTLTADIVTRQPELIALDNRETCYACPPGLNLFAYLDSVGFIGQVIDPGYTFVGEADGLAFYRRRQ